MSEPKKTKTRRYVLTNNQTGDKRIVTATTKSQALSHAAKTDWSIAPLSIDEAIKLTREGVDEEVAGDADAPEQLPLQAGDGN